MNSFLNIYQFISERTSSDGGGLFPIPEIIYLGRKICPRINCDFRKGCKGTEEGRQIKFVCHPRELIKIDELSKGCGKAISTYNPRFHENVK